MPTGGTGNDNKKKSPESFRRINCSVGPGQRKERRRMRFLYTLALRMWDAKSTAESAATEPQLVTSVTSLLVTSEISLHTVSSVQWPEYSAWHHLGLSGS